MTKDKLLSALEWRYATNKFDANKKLDESTVNTILEAANLSATSFGLQAYKMVLLDGEKWREKLNSVTFGQDNIHTCSHLLVLCARMDMNREYIQSYVHYMESERGLEKGTMDKYAEVCVEFIQKMDAIALNQWLRRQAYIVLGNLLNTCALLEVDACPMEGFIPEKLDEILGLENRKLKSVLLFPMGYRSEDDKYAQLKKVRKPLDEMVLRL